MKKRKAKTKVKPIRYFKSEFKNKGLRNLSDNSWLDKKYKSKKLFYTILWFIVITILILLILLFIYNIDLEDIKKEIKLSPALSGLPDGFIPSFGYWHNFGGNRVVLWDSQGNAFVSTDGSSFSILSDSFKQSIGLPPTANFKPVLGYYLGFPGAETIVLWGSNREIYVRDISTGKFALLSTGINNDPSAAGQLPGNFIPELAYYHEFDNGRIVLWDADEGYVAASNWYFIKLSGNPAGENKAPNVAYYFNINGYKAIHSWVVLNSGEIRLYEFNSSTGGGFVRVNQLPAGLPTNQVPTVGYFDKTVTPNRIVLWYGDIVYVSTDAKTFTRIGGSSCTSDCTNKVCGDDDGCGGLCDVDASCELGFTCSNGVCTEFLASSSCRDSDEGSNAQGYYTKGNVTYHEGDINITKNDSCLNSIALVEWYCEGDVGRNQTYNCPSGCLDSVCTGTPEESCQDSDNGLTFGTRGFVNYSLNSVSNIHNDTCIDEFQLKEYYCDENNQTTSLLYDCLENQFCSNSACVLISDAQDNDNPPPTPTGDCTDGEEACEGDYYILCANGQWLEPRRVSGKCDYRVSDTDSDTENLDSSSSLGDNKKSNFWMYFFIIFFIVLILGAGGIIIYILIKRKKQKNKSSQYYPPSNSNITQQYSPRPPPAPPQTLQPTQQYSSSGLPSRSPQQPRVFERPR